MSFIVSEVADRERQANQQRALSLSTWLLSLAIMGLALTPAARANRAAKAGMVMSAVALTAVSKATARNLSIHDRVLEDYRDISDNARQQSAYEAMKPKENIDLVELPPVESDEPEELLTHDLPAVLAGSLKSALVLGAPRSGKGYAVAKALELLPSNVRVWLIDPKRDDNESHYWDRVPAERRVRLDVTALSKETLNERVVDLFTRFCEAPSSKEKPKLLIVDECSPGLRMGMVAKDYKDMMGRIATIASVGPSLGKFVWVLSQANTVEDVGLSRANRASLRIVAVAHTGKTELSWLKSVRATVDADMPDPRLSGFIQMVGSKWGAAKPIELTPAPEPSDAELGLSDDAEAVLESMKNKPDPVTLKSLLKRKVAKVCDLTKAQDMEDVLSELIEAGMVVEQGGYFKLVTA